MITFWNAFPYCLHSKKRQSSTLRKKKNPFFCSDLDSTFRSHPGRLMIFWDSEHETYFLSKGQTNSGRISKENVWEIPLPSSAQIHKVRWFVGGCRTYLDWLHWQYWGCEQQKKYFQGKLISSATNCISADCRMRSNTSYTDLIQKRFKLFRRHSSKQQKRQLRGRY